MMRFNPLYAPDGMMSAGHYSASHDAERFDDGLVHNHHWAVTADEAYPSHGHASAIDHPRHGVVYEASSLQSHREPTHAYDRHDDGLVHNHAWAVAGK